MLLARANQQIERYEIKLRPRRRRRRGGGRGGSTNERGSTDTKSGEAAFLAVETTTSSKKQKDIQNNNIHHQSNNNNNNNKVFILWDLDNINPGTTCERFAINAYRLRRNAEKFGEVQSFTAFAGRQTSESLSECCSVLAKNEFLKMFERLEIEAKFWLDGPDAADVVLGKDLMKIANEVSENKYEVPKFTTQRFAAYERVVEDFNESEAQRRFFRTLAIQKQEELKQEGERINDMCRDLKLSSDETRMRQIMKNRKNIAIVVSNDRDLKLPIDFAISSNMCVVVIGNFVNNNSNRKKSIKKKSYKRLNNNNNNNNNNTDGDDLNEYLNQARLEAQNRPISRLKLLENCDAALAWDSTRKFIVNEDESNFIANNSDDDKAVGSKTIAGDVIGLWRKNKVGLGSW